MKQRNILTSIKGNHERCHLENCLLGRKGSLHLWLKTMEIKPSWNWNKENEMEKKIIMMFCGSTFLLLETWKTRKSLGMCYCHKTSCSTEIGLLRFSASVRKRQDGNLSWKWSTSELVGKVRNNPSQIRNFVRKLVLPYPTRNKPTPSNIHIFRGLQCLTACSSCLNVVVTQLLVRPWPLKSSKRHPIPLTSGDAVLSPCAMAVVISPQVFSTTAEVAIFEFSANTTVSSVRNLFLLSINTCNVSKTSFAANKSSKSTR